MSRVDRRWPMTLAATVLLVACGAPDDGAKPAPTPEPSPRPVLESSASPQAVPDFEAFVRGDLPRVQPQDRDPFSDATRPAPTVAPEKTYVAPAPRLRGIVQSDGRLVALFDRGSAASGETLRGWHVREVTARAVVLVKGPRVSRQSL